MILDNKKVLVTGGTGSLGKVLVRRLLTGEMGHIDKLIVFSRDEAKQHEMRLNYQSRRFATDEVIYRNTKEILEFHIGDVRDYHSIAGVMKDVDVIFKNCPYLIFETGIELGAGDGSQSQYLKKFIKNYICTEYNQERLPFKKIQGIKYQAVDATNLASVFPSLLS